MQMCSVVKDGRISLTGNLLGFKNNRDSLTLTCHLEAVAISTAFLFFATKQLAMPIFTLDLRNATVPLNYHAHWTENLTSAVYT